MIRKINLMVIVLMVSVVLRAQNKANRLIENDWQKNDLKGTVQSSTMVQYEVKEEWGSIVKTYPSKSLIKDYQKNFDKEGNLIENKFYDGDDVLRVTKITYLYDEKGNQLEELQRYEDGTFFRCETYQYDDRGRMIEKNIYWTDSSMLARCTYTYDEGNYLIESNLVYAQGVPSKYEYIYNAQGMLIQENYYRGENQIQMKRIYTYDEKGNLIEYSEYDELDIFVEKYTYSYDTLGNLIESNYYNYDLILFKREKFDINGNWIESGSVSRRIVYDAQGNWVTIIWFSNDVPRYLYERTIVYFD